MDNSVSPEHINLRKDDRILPATRIVLAIVVPFLLLAFLILYFFPDLSGERFVWEIKPHMTALFIGSGYLSGAYMFVYAIFGLQWHRVAGAFPPVISFTTFMLLSTFLHWDRFNIHHFPFQLWLVLYIITPPLIFYLWWLNRRTDPVNPESGEISVPVLARRAFFWFGVTTMLWAIIMFVFPEVVSTYWPWKLTPLTARILAGWFSLLGVGGLYTSSEIRWSAWQIPLQSITLWAALVVLASFLNPDDFSTGIWNSFTIGTLLSLLMLLTFQFGIHMTKRKIH
ncbi:MAG: hypothetical protein ABIJ65_05155 [Chloroflexota bacterium]